MALDLSSAKFSGRGTQMMSRNGATTISHYLCFKSGYTNEEIKQTGLKQVVNDDKYALVQLKDPYFGVTKKVFTNAHGVTQKGSLPESQKIIQIREQIAQQKELERKMNRWPGQGYEYIENMNFELYPYGTKKKTSSF